LACVLVLAGGTVARPADLLFPADGGPARLRLEVTVGGRPPEAAWEAFLDRLFDHFDRNGDGSLSPAEASRVIPLPLPGGRSVAMDFARLDTDRDGRGSRAEFREFYRRAGFTPVVVVVVPPSAEGQRLSASLFRHLDRDGDGRLTRAELARAPALLRRLDEDDDEALTAAEICPPDGPAPAVAPEPTGLRVEESSVPAATLRLALGPSASLPLLGAGGTVFRATDRGPAGAFRFTVPGGVCSVTVPSGHAAIGTRAATSFYRAQFKAALGTRPAATKAELDQDPTLQVLAGLFEAADWDGDGRLTQAELDRFLGLVELGAGCLVVVAVDDRGHNLFELIDENGDGRLDLGELARAARLLPPDGTADSRRPDTVPRQFRLSAAAGPVGPRFGPVPLGSRPRGPAAALPPPPARGPKWFRAMDRNGDGFLSPQEFLGPPDLFRRLDADGDGRISAAEAERAGETLAPSFR
jgi:Ca2+-binding EF-hand superfamily protein